MKYRSDYVTNSSSSSFVIGKKDDETVTIESVYQTIRKLYKERLEKRDVLIQYIKDNPKFGLTYKESEDGRYSYFKFLNREDDNWERNKAIKGDFGINTWDYFYKEEEWLHCSTYQEYEKYWLDRMRQANDYRIHAPFTIADFLEEKEIYWLHYGKGNKEMHHVNNKSEILHWYYEYSEKAFEDISCEECWRKDWCNQEECLEEREELKNVPKEQACLYLLGRICIYSECGYIPDHVVEKLIEISTYSCNHMG